MCNFEEMFKSKYPEFAHYVFNKDASGDLNVDVCTTDNVVLSIANKAGDKYGAKWWILDTVGEYYHVGDFECWLEVASAADEFNVKQYNELNFGYHSSFGDPHQVEGPLVYLEWLMYHNLEQVH